jgi:hypothetical protein
MVEEKEQMPTATFFKNQSNLFEFKNFVFFPNNAFGLNFLLPETSENS